MDELYIRYETDCGVFYRPFKSIVKIKARGEDRYEVLFAYPNDCEKVILSAEELKQVRPYSDWFGKP